MPVETPILFDVKDSAGKTKNATVVFAARTGSGVGQIAALSIEPNQVTLKTGETRQFKALGILTDRSQPPKDVTDQATWEGLEADRSFTSIASRFTRRERPERGIGAGVPPCNARDVSLTVLHRGKFSRRVGRIHGNTAASSRNANFARPVLVGTANAFQ